MTLQFDEGSFKDPEGRVGFDGDHIIRVLTPPAQERIRALFHDPVLRNLFDQKLLLPSQLLNNPERGWYIEHAKLPFVSYPYEWSFDMLREAASATLNTLELCLDHDHILKDATPFNMGWFEGKMVLFDLPSIERYREGSPWVGYQQFCQEFLYPLMLTSYTGVEFQPWMRAFLTGIPAASTASLLGKSRWLRRGIFSRVVLSAWLEKSFSDANVTATSAIPKGLFNARAIRKNIQQLRRLIESLRYKPEKAHWLSYENESTYSDQEKQTKLKFIEECFDPTNENELIDLGCNLGAFSRPLQKRFQFTVAVDGDPGCVNALYHRVKTERLEHYLPLIQDLLNPSPSQGWDGNERKSFTARWKGKNFIALALIHHVVIGGNVPMDKFIHYLTKMGTNGVVEWVDKKDSMAQKLLSRREDIFPNYEWPQFQKALAEQFTVSRVQELKDGLRKLVFVEAKTP